MMKSQCGKIRSPKHLKYVSQQPCCVCGWWDETVVPHHLLRAGGKALATKACDSLAVPLHNDCHQELHFDGDEVGWFESQGLSYDEVKQIAADLCKSSPCRKIRGKA